MILQVPPVDIGRDEARDAAARELARSVYHRDDPSWPVRIGRWIIEWLAGLIDAAARVSPGGYVGLLVVALLLVVAIVAIRLRIGPIARTTTGDRALFDAAPQTAADHRRAADAHATRGEWAEAVRARLRAVVRGLEERDLLDARAGRTAHEAAREAGAVLPDCAADLRAAATTFDDIWYGAQAATAEMDAQLRAVDDAVRRARPLVVS